jgi:hypothetical protein
MVADGSESGVFQFGTRSFAVCAVSVMVLVNYIDLSLVSLNVLSMFNKFTRSIVRRDERCALTLKYWSFWQATLAGAGIAEALGTMNRCLCARTAALKESV